MGQHTILIADDDPQIRLALRTRLAADGYEIVECCDGLAVLAKIRTQRVDALVLDHEMPLGDGRTIANIIRGLTEAPIIFLSGHDKEDFRDTVLRLRDAYFLRKPLDGRKLSELLESLTRSPALATI